MKIRAAILAAAIAAIGTMGTTAVVAQSDAMATRQNLMKENDRNARVVIQMMRGRAPFDAVKADAAFAQWADTAQKLPGLFPDDSKTGGKTRASRKIWQNKADFDAKAAALAKSVAENRGKATDLDGLKAAVNAVAPACDNCHELYRLPE